MEINFLALLVAAVSTLFIGFVWYHPKVFGTIWLKETGLTEEQCKKGNMSVIFGMAILYAFFISLILQFNVIHQWGAFSTIAGDATNESFKTFMTNENRDAFRTFKHGALHGLLVGLFMALPIIGTNSLFEKRSSKYVIVSGGFWIACLTLMGGIICAWE